MIVESNIIRLFGWNCLVYNSNWFSVEIIGNFKILVFIFSVKFKNVLNLVKTYFEIMKNWKWNWIEKANRTLNVVPYTEKNSMLLKRWWRRVVATMPLSLSNKTFILLVLCNRTLTVQVVLFYSWTYTRTRCQNFCYNLSKNQINKLINLVLWRTTS